MTPWTRNASSSTDVNTSPTLRSTPTDQNALAFAAKQPIAPANHVSRPGNDQDSQTPEMGLPLDAPSAPGVDFELAGDSADLWSAAYREAVESLGQDINVAILKGDNVAELFRQLETLDKDATQESAFIRGVKYLQSIQVPLEKFKLALHLASPPHRLSLIAISFATADLGFAKQIGEMLEQLSYIDDCDTLGQKTEKKKIHSALVKVYQKLLEFYNAAFEILSNKRGVKLVMKVVVLEDGHLPEIVSEFLTHGKALRKLIENAMLEIVEDIKCMLYDQEIARWLGSDKTARQSQHHTYLHEIRADQACEFLLADAGFVSWHHAADSRQLIVLGEMGSGKSVSMAFLIDELRRRNEHQLPQPKVCYHYCQNDGTGETAHIFSSLILSLLEQLPGLKKGFFQWYKQAMASGIEPATDFRKLEEWLQETLKTLDRPLIFAIDGLDECDGPSRNCLLNSLQHLSKTTPRLKVLLSCRPQEDILQKLSEMGERGRMSRVEMSSDAKRDGFIVEKTVERQLSYLSRDVKSHIIETLSRRAQGSPIWIKMTVELIQVRGIRALGPMQAFLQAIPQPRNLSDLYTKLFLRYTSNDADNQALATAALEILAVTRRSLSILELAWAATLGAAQEAIPTVDALAEWVDYQRVMSMIQPFVARVDFGDLKKRQVKLAHQSVKEFVIEQWGSDPPSLEQNPAVPTRAKTTSGQTHVDTQQRTGELEARLLDICTKYLLLQNIGNTNLFSEEHVPIEELPQEADLFSDNDEPNNYDHYCSWETWEETMIRYDTTERGFGELFTYASCYWIEHLGAASVDLLPSRLGKIERLCQAGSIRLHNWTAQNCRPDCVIKARFVFDSSLHDPLTIGSLHGSEAMLQQILEDADFNKDTYLINPAMGAADQILQWGDLARLGLLWKSKIGHQLHNMDFFRLVLERWSRYPIDKHRQGWDKVFDLINDVLEKMVEDKWGSQLLTIAARRGCMPVIQRLIHSAQRTASLRAELLTEPSHSGPGCIGEAVLGSHLDVVEYLLQQSQLQDQRQDAIPHLHHRTPHGENVLHLASRLCNPFIFRLLVPRLPSILHQKDDCGDTPLIRIITSPAASRDRYESARILLSAGRSGGANVEEEEQQQQQQQALRVATQVGDPTMYRLFLDLFANTANANANLGPADKAPQTGSVPSSPTFKSLHLHASGAEWPGDGKPVTEVTCQQARARAT